MRMRKPAGSLALVALLALAGGCTAAKRIDMEPAVLREELRAGGVVRAGDRVTVVSDVQGDLAFVVTEVDSEVLRGESIEVPIDEIVVLEKREFALLRTAGAVAGTVYGGTFLIGMTVAGLSVIWLILF